mmetsp:Transcript_4555/g.15157  ORF Transcript_4555/g.15157 Transcript_4555/m.15157 type:complete len:349 (-) Transcript_4555:735-1781(-)
MVMLMLGMMAVFVALVVIHEEAAAEGLDDGGGLEPDFVPLVVDVGEGGQGAAGADRDGVDALAGGRREEEGGADDHREVGVAAEAEVAEGAGIGAPRTAVFEFVDDGAGPSFRGAGHRSRGEGRPEDVEGVALVAEVAGDRRHELVDRREGLEVGELVDGGAVADPEEVRAEQVRDHQVLRARLHRRREGRGLPRVAVRVVDEPRRGPLDRLGFDRPAPDADEPLRGRTAHGDAPRRREVQERVLRRGILRAETLEPRQRIEASGGVLEGSRRSIRLEGSIRLEPRVEARRQAHFVAVARGDALEGGPRLGGVGRGRPSRAKGQRRRRRRAAAPRPRRSGRRASACRL